MKRFKYLLAWVFILLVVILNILNLILILQINSKNEQQQHDIQVQSKEADASLLKRIDDLNVYVQNINPKDGYTPKKGIDYFDGINGKDGLDGKNATDEQVQNAVNNYMLAHPITNGTDGSNGVNGLTPDIRCNSVKNRWEVRYEGTTLWKILDNDPVKCTIGN